MVVDGSDNGDTSSYNNDDYWMDDRNNEGG